MIKHKNKNVDDPRFSINMDNSNEFKALLKNVNCTKDTPELFPRPQKGYEPVMSYGIVLCKITEDSIYYFVCRRRTTVEFSEVVKCGPRKDRLYHYFSNMTPKERKLLTTVPHEKLWNDLLLEERDMFYDTKIRVQEIFKSYEGVLEKLIDLTQSNTTTPPFEFTKGRLNALLDKTLLGTAVRELKEEAGIHIKGPFDLIEDVMISDAYKGTDNLAYQTNYYVIRVPELYEPRIIFHENNSIEDFCISKDMHNYMWVQLQKHTNHVRGCTPLTPRLESLLLKVHNRLCRL